MMIAIAMMFDIICFKSAVSYFKYLKFAFFCTLPYKVYNAILVNVCSREIGLSGLNIYKIY